jgi:hypothetical protein
MPICPDYPTVQYNPVFNTNAIIYREGLNPEKVFIDSTGANALQRFVDTSTLNFTLDPVTDQVSATIPLRINGTTVSQPTAAAGVTATAVRVVAGGVLTGFTSLVGGSGYLTAPLVTFGGVATGGVAPTAIAVINGNGVVTAINVNTPGSGLTNALTVTLAAPTGGNASGYNFTSTGNTMAITNGSAGAINLESTTPAIVTATATAGAATANGTVLRVTTEPLTTAAAGIYTLVITNSSVTATSFVQVNLSRGAGFTTGQPVVLSATPAANTITVLVRNLDAAAPFNGALVLNTRVLN